MNTTRRTRQQLLSLLCRIQSPKLMNAALETLLSENEFQDLEKRLQIFQLLEANMPQREIAAKLNVGIATVTRGAQAYRHGKLFELEPDILKVIQKS